MIITQLHLDGFLVYMQEKYKKDEITAKDLSSSIKGYIRSFVKTTKRRKDAERSLRKALIEKGYIEEPKKPEIILTDA